MDKYGLVSNYTIKQFKVHKTSCNEEKIENKVDIKFNDREQMEVIISDLIYVRVRDKWCYICILIDFFNLSDKRIIIQMATLTDWKVLPFVFYTYIQFSSMV